MLKHAREVRLNEPVRDGDFDAVVVKVYTGAQGGTSLRDRYVITINHGLGRTPVGCQIVNADRVCAIYTISSDENRIVLKANAAEATLTIRVW